MGDQPQGDQVQSGTTPPVNDDDEGKFVKDKAQGTSYTDPMPSGGKGASLSFFQAVRQSLASEGPASDVPLTGPVTNPHGEDPKTEKSDSPSLQEGAQPEGDHAEPAVKEPEPAQDKSTWGGNPDSLSTGGTDGSNASSGANVPGTPTHASVHTAGEYQGGSPKEGDTATCHKDGGKIQFFDGQWMHLKGTGGDHNDVYPATPKEQAEKTSSLADLGARVAAKAQTSNVTVFGQVLATMASLEETRDIFTGRDLVNMVLASGDVDAEDRQALEAVLAAEVPPQFKEQQSGGDSGSSEGGNTCETCGHSIAKDPSGENPSTWHHDDGEKHDHEAKPKTASKTAVSLTKVKIKDEGQNLAAGVDTSGKEVVFRVTPKEMADLKSVLFSDLAMNFSGVEVEESDIVKDAGLGGGTPFVREARQITAGESVEVSVIPDCDICKYEEQKEGVPAAYDGATTSGRWAYMCERHFGTHGVGLGTGRGQRLVKASARHQAAQAEFQTDWKNADGSVIDWQNSDKPFPRGFRDGYEGKPKQG